MPWRPVRIPDHADRTLALLPSAHATDRWTALVRALVGVRGAWAESEDIVVVQAGSTTPALPAFAAPFAELADLFGAGGLATIAAGLRPLRSPPSDELGDVALSVYDGAAVALQVTTDAVWTAFATHDLRRLPDDLADEVIVNLVSGEIVGAPTGLQELEGEGHKLLLLRTLEWGFGEQLDLVGELLGLTRDEDDDEEYRRRLRWKAAVNNSQGTGPEILTAASSISTPEYERGQLIEAFPAHMILYLHGSSLEAGVRRLIRQMPREGVGMSVTSADSLNPLVTGPDGGWYRMTALVANVATLQVDATGGFAIGDRVRGYRVTGDVAGAEVTVKGVSGTQVELDGSTLGPSLGHIVILENLTRGEQDDDGHGLEDAYQIVGVNQGTRTLTLLGLAASPDGDGSQWRAGERLRVVGSTGNDRIYQVVSASNVGGNTNVVVAEVIPSAVADGHALHASPGLAAALGSSPAGIDSAHGELADEFVDEGAESPA